MCASGKYLNWDNICVNDCNAPLTTRILHDNLFCEFTCNDPSNKFLLNNKTCTN